MLSHIPVFNLNIITTNKFKCFEPGSPDADKHILVYGISTTVLRKSVGLSQVTESLAYPDISIYIC